MKLLLPLLAIVLLISCKSSNTNSDLLIINDQNYFELPGLNVMVFEDIYPEGHQGGVGIIQHGIRVATNGDVRLEATPGQWQPIPKVGKRTVDKENNEISVKLWYPDSAINRKGFNPVIYPDLVFTYQVRVVGEKDYFRIIVDLDQPLPEEWIGKAGFNLELYPATLFGKTWMMDGKTGFFTRQANGPVALDENNENQSVPLATGRKLIIAPETDEQRISIESTTSDLELLDGRIRHTNGWFVVRSAIPSGAAKGAIEWTVRANHIPGWISPAVVHVSQVGYHPQQTKTAVIETDVSERKVQKASLVKITSSGSDSVVKTIKPDSWGKFLRYNYLLFDFTDVKEGGTYLVQYDDARSNTFMISSDVYSRHVWQPTLEYFLPVQMCHMRVTDAYKVWHNTCHLDDALMAPTDTILFDGYRQGPSTLTRYKPGDRVPGLDRGGWHDAGDDDLRVESQAGTVQLLSLAWEEFRPDLDATTIDQAARNVVIHVPDGRPDVLQQIEHGVLTILGGYENMGRVYRGIISPTIPQYTLVGDVSSQTDNLPYNRSVKYNNNYETRQGIKDDRMVFTEENPGHEFSAIQGLAAAARVLRDYDDGLADRCLNAATGLWHMKRDVSGREISEQINAASELLITTGNREYSDFLVRMSDSIPKRISSVGWVVVRALSLVDDATYKGKVEQALAGLSEEIENQGKETPFGVPYRPHIWGAGWNIQEFGVQQYYLSKFFPKLFSLDYMYNALNFVLGCHPGENTASFASGVGSRSMTIAYGYNRADWSYIPGGVVSGTSLIRPDFPELKDFPFLWQQAEYVIGGGEMNYMFLVLAAEEVLSRE
ncbi:MAG: glycoside hydrolase family 9 protein [Bacteroidales bacterium]|nr:glycoside hydrolase family 9 protein [Bacteroidales bacterium]